MKTCSLDCIYCQLGETTNKTIERREWVPVDVVIGQIEQKLKHGPKADYITLSGSGEPTLNSRIGDVIRAAKKASEVPVAVLTNGTLLWDAAVREALWEADLVVPSLDAPDEATYQRINRPHPAVNFDVYYDGLREFAKGRSNTLWLEIFLLDGINADAEAMGAFHGLIAELAPDRLQLNTAVRPTAVPEAKAVSPKKMDELASVLGLGAEVIADFSGLGEKEVGDVSADDILQMLRRRPCTVGDMAAGLDAHEHVIVKWVTHLLRDGAIAEEIRQGKRYYLVR